MELIYKNDYGACYRVSEFPNPKCKIQLIVDSIGIFLTEADLEHLLHVIQNSDQPCYCPECQGRKSKNIWSSGPMYDICLKVDEQTLPKIEDLIVGTRFILNMDDTLRQHRIQ